MKINLPIQYLRGIAALLVVFAHFHYFPIIKYFYGAIGVDIFFIISGIIMSSTVEKYKDKKIEFFTNRLIRIYPLYIIVSLPIFWHQQKIGELSSIVLIKSLLFFGGSFEKYKDPLLFVGWTLFYEFIFYGIIILFANSKQLTNVLLLTIGLIGLIIPIHNITGLILNPFFLYFFIGFNFKPILNTFKTTKLGLHLFLSSIIMAIVMLFPDTIGPNYVPRLHILVGDHLLPRFLFWGIPTIYFIVAFLKYFDNHNEIKILKFLGDMSYSIYLVHILLITFAESVYINHPINGLSKHDIYTLFFLLIIPVSYLTYQIIEIRLSGWLKDNTKNFFK